MQQQFSRFAIVGGCGFILDISVFSALVYLMQWPSELARVMAFIIALAVTWFGHRQFTFSHRQQEKVTAQAKWVVLIACLAAMANLGGFMLTHWAWQWWFTPNLFSSQLCLIVGVALGWGVNYIGADRLTYRQRNTQELGSVSSCAQ